ncbi:tRNA pseudouridine synthase Pus10 [Brachionichthys hirsutus]|uniref:tRNA pseudouridine synthase Pus10 n=1 Tax=Brachionichthys hirsutus TaxID=412623 RepID=UPI003604B181
MLPLKDSDKPIVRKLLDAGCCPRCVLRFCCVGVQAAYRRARQDTLTELQAFIGNTGGNHKSHDATASEPPGHPPSKRARVEAGACGAAEEEAAAVAARSDEDVGVAARRDEDVGVAARSDEDVGVAARRDEDVGVATRRGEDVCVACLGILQELCDAAQATEIAEAVKAQSFDFCTLVLSVSLPAQLFVREHSCWLHVKTDQREKSVALSKDDVIQVKEAYKWVMQGRVAKELGGVAVVTRSPFEIAVEFIHPETEADCHFLASTCRDAFKPTKNKQSVFTRMAVVKALDKTADARFLQHYPSPPARPTSRCVPQDVQCLHASVFIAGRYNKFCRSLPQTPWVIDGERRMESSVEELIAAPVLSPFRAKGFNFSSSGREDVDVRTLGNGRPFAMELLNPHRSRLSNAEMKQLQEAINRSSDKIRVRDLQIVTREATSRMKEGEEEKTKSYTALVWTQRPIQREDLTFIQDIKDLTLDQKTPLRVLHRRTLAVRQRVVHSMSARFLDSHHFHLVLKTQAGTYIKEFVHGDFGRTKPNMCELLQTDADILELDVESVDVDWPPPIPE